MSSVSNLPDSPDNLMLDFPIPDKPKEPTIGEVKVENWFNSRLESESFKAEIFKLREKYKIPRFGLEEKDPGLLFDYPMEWHYFNSPYMRRRLANDLIKIIGNFQFLGMTPLQLHPLLFYNLKFNYRTRHPFNLKYSYGYPDQPFCLLTDASETKSLERAREKSSSPDHKIASQLDKLFPVIIRINAYAQKKDITRFIEDNEDKIEEALKEHRKNNIKLGKIRTKDSETMRVYNFIYDHKDLPNKDILEMVKKKYGKTDWEEGHIARVLEIMKDRRA